MGFLRKYAILCSTLVLCGLLLVFFHNLSPQFQKTEKDYKEHRAVNLSAKTSKTELADLLFGNGYVDNTKDAAFIADTLVERLTRLEYPNLYHLQKRAYGKVPMLVADSAGVLTKKVNHSNDLVGISDSLPSTKTLSSTLDKNDGDGELAVIINSKESSNLGDVLIKVEEHYLQADSVISEVIGYVKTDGSGFAQIKGLDRSKGYSVLPIKRGYEYGNAKGIAYGHFDNYKFFNKFWKINYVFEFDQVEHRIQMIDNYTLKQIKDDGTLTVRTPKEYKTIVIRWFVMVLLGWWILCFVLIRRKKNFDSLIVAAAMFLTGLCVLLMFSIQNPLTEELRGVEMATGVLMGLVCVIILQYVDFIKFYQNKYRVGFDVVDSFFCFIISCFKKPFSEQTSWLIALCKGHSKWYKKLEATTLIALIFLLYVPIWLFLSYKKKVDRLTPLLVDNKTTVSKKCLVTFFIFICLLLHMVSCIIRWFFLPFKRKVSWLTNIMIQENQLVIWKILALLLLIICIPFSIIDLLYIVIKWPAKWLVFLYNKSPKGFGWILLALLLTSLLWTPLGQSIGGMKVNLRVAGLTFQPSEIAKYLIIFFISAFFVQNADTIISYSRPTSTRIIKNLKNKIKILSFVVAGLIVLMGIYAIIGDMGPGLVIGVTFILLYSLVKSKVNLENLSDTDKWQRIFTCDFAMLIYGVLSFAIFVVLGGMIGDSLTGAMLWFVGWVIYGVTRHKQFFETAFIMNMLIFAFIFGGQVLQNIPGLEDTDTAVRFEQRTRMCVNTWGNLNLENKADSAEAVSNTQVANGLWALATGGITGQGMGEGNPNLIPAFHTDMILSSIGEQAGWIGLLIVVFVMGTLLRRMIVVGYKVGHPFAFYFCSGVAIVTGVQFFIIALGSSGMIPLTGITVPLLSYGRVSMILNLIALGVVLSLSQNIGRMETEIVKEKIQQRSVGDYNYPVSIVTWTFIVLALFTLGVWQYYCLWNRGKTLIHPAFVYTKEGTPIIEYNPRIAMLTKEMWAGNIYDRNGLLLATSNKDILNEKEIKKLEDSCGLSKEKIISLTKAHVKRYYPFGEHLFFMLGDINNGLYFNSSIGYMAESRHLSYLRNYDNAMRDKEGNAVEVYLKEKTREGNRFIKGREHEDIIRYVVRDNRELIKYLKDGIYGKALAKHNKKVQNGKFDLHLTLDANLQTKMQNEITEVIAKTPALKNNNLFRISIVVLDAKNGDLLTSANYPLPDYQRLQNEEENARIEGKKFVVYSDNCKNDEWTAYTDRDLGMTYQTQPGSTAKVMSAIAGFMKMGSDAVKKSYMVYSEEKIDTKLGEPIGNVSLHDAIVESSNCYFVNSVNDMNLYRQLGEIYKATGVRIDRETINTNGRTVIDKSLTPYFYYVNEISDTPLFDAEVAATSERGTRIYNKYIDQRTKNHKYRKMNWSQCGWAWGQGTLRATPLNMARVASIVVNNGSLPQTRYLLSEPVIDTKVCDVSLDNLKSYMLDQARIKGGILNSSIGGKTGTPERNHTMRNRRGFEETKSKNDAWYIFFVDSEGVNQSKANKLAVALRIERANATSGLAMQITRDVIIHVLTETEYIK